MKPLLLVPLLSLLTLAVASELQAQYCAYCSGRFVVVVVRDAETRRPISGLRVTTRIQQLDSFRTARRDHCYHGAPDTDSATIEIEGDRPDTAERDPFYLLLFHGYFHVRAFVHVEDMDGEAHGGLFETQDIEIASESIVNFSCCDDDAIWTGRYLHTTKPEQTVVINLRRKSPEPLPQLDVRDHSDVDQGTRDRINVDIHLEGVMCGVAVTLIDFGAQTPIAGETRAAIDVAHPGRSSDEPDRADDWRDTATKAMENGRSGESVRSLHRKPYAIDLRKPGPSLPRCNIE